MFVARENEISRIKQFLSKRGALLIYGLRRVGKTTLIKKVLEESNRDYIYFECQKADEKINVSLFVDLLKEKMAFVDAQFDSFLTVFKEIKIELNYKVLLFFHEIKLNQRLFFIINAINFKSK